MKRFKLYPMFLYPLIALYQLEVVPEGYVDLGMKFVYSKNVRTIHNNTNPLMKIQRESLILGNDMSSGVTVPIFGKKIAKMKQREQLELQENSCENKASV